jgi:predicted secreted protein
MSQAVPFGGKDLRVMRKSSPTDANPSFLCTVTTKTLTETTEFDDATVPNCDEPGAVAARRSIPKMTAWSINASGIADAKSYKQLRADSKSGVPLDLQILVAKPAAAGGGHWDGAVFFENLQIQSDNMGVIKFSAQMRGEGDLAWTDATT